MSRSWVMNMFRLEDCVVFFASNKTRLATEAFNDLLTRHGSTRVQWTALYFIANNPEINQSRLSELMSIKSSTVVRLIDRMMKEGLVIRKPLPADKRNSLLYCTQKGLDLYHELLPLGIQFNAKIMEGIDQEQLDTFLEVLEKIVENARNLDN